MPGHATWVWCGSAVVAWFGWIRRLWVLWLLSGVCVVMGWLDRVAVGWCLGRAAWVWRDGAVVAWLGWIGRLWVLWPLVRSVWWRGGLLWSDENVGWGGVGWGEWFVHERAEHVCKEAEYAGLKGGLINRVLGTWFLGGYHMEKMPHQIWSYHGNWVFETRFIVLNWVF